MKPKPPMRTPDESKRDDRPWWRYGMVWLVISGPVLVVLAGIVTAVIAVRGADPVLDTRATPTAVESRNHTATPAGRP